MNLRNIYEITPEFKSYNYSKKEVKLKTKRREKSYSAKLIIRRTIHRFQIPCTFTAYSIFLLFEFLANLTRDQVIN